jgi:glycosyltransferase involved in cell wall biosynthesis
LVCVDDGSSDDSLAILNELAEADARITVIAQPQNMGKGKAIRTASVHTGREACRPGNKSARVVSIRTYRCISC